MMMRILSAVALCLALTGATQAAASCYVNRPGVDISFGVKVGGTFTEADRNEFYMLRLRGMGVDATSVEMWGGCVRAFVRKPGGGEEMQLFHPQSLERVG
ncbi:hypothetical protein DEVEQU_02471 [Devosia equisanguinis]|uniref:Porin n=1 Tax=Devosia equisanguinis TaxID=2490941 RepID=A0A447ICX2_9HYPH|nr:hypothetical protein [Devosia equisanguinis]VDS05329.1 hypothetical protein DEVEQU_02471 [Devosia equisanguinis]